MPHQKAGYIHANNHMPKPKNILQIGAVHTYVKSVSDFCRKHTGNPLYSDVS